MTEPRVSIVIPTLGREEATRILVASLPVLAGWMELEIIVEPDAWEDRQGCPKTLAKGVARASGDYICFLGNDCRPAPGFLRHAMRRMRDTFPDGVGLVGFNDGIVADGRIATHWVAAKALLPLIGGEFFHTGYHHVGCDNELTARCQLLGKYVWEPEARLIHDHPARLGWGNVDAVHTAAWSRHEADRELLHQRAAQYGFTHLLV